MSNKDKINNLKTNKNLNICKIYKNINPSILLKYIYSE